MVERKSTNRIIYHHSLTKDGNATSIGRWHTEHNGWEDIGYHFVILKNGEKQEGRKLSLVGAHAYGKNADSIGVCLIGDFRTEYPTEAQIETCVKLQHALNRYYSKNLSIEFHRDLYSPCPGKMLCRKCFVRRLKEGDI